MGPCFFVNYSTIEPTPHEKPHNETTIITHTHHHLLTTKLSFITSPMGEELIEGLMGISNGILSFQMFDRRFRVDILGFNKGNHFSRFQCLPRGQILRFWFWGFFICCVLGKTMSRKNRDQGAEGLV
ncbi:unnamed protein product [Lactuca saligna]|uniref:Uncharacterized protein n=1 Tax=Lactuca saligna TaxID=75948 RepID=A0AA35ZBL7_LACSI|nr:unnamed protein product [Lactuca saligna]